MPKSKSSPRHKAYKKEKNEKKLLIKKQIKQMSENLTKGPRTFTYHKNTKTVEVPLKEWQVLNDAANRLQDIAMFVSTMEQVGRLHLENGTLMPVFDSDLEPSETKNPDGSFQLKIKDSFWNKGKIITGAEEKPTQVVADGNVIYEASQAEVDIVETTKLN